MEESKSFTNVA